MRESWTIPSDEEVEDFTKAYLAAQESYYEEQEGEEDQIEQLEYNLAVTEQNINYYVNGNQ